MEIRRDEDDEFLSSSRVAGETGGKTISWRFKNDIFAGGDWVNKGFDASSLWKLENRFVNTREKRGIVLGVFWVFRAARKTWEVLWASGKIWRCFQSKIEAIFEATTKTQAVSEATSKTQAVFEATSKTQAISKVIHDS
jgi:hypothetical protein